MPTYTHAIQSRTNGKKLSRYLPKCAPGSWEDYEYATSIEDGEARIAKISDSFKLINDVRIVSIDRANCPEDAQFQVK